MIDNEFVKTGIASREMVMNRFPAEERIDSGPVAVIECYMKIPCNPCETACRFNAIHIGEDINNIPEIDVSKCTGCSVCLSKCPGLSIVIVDGSRDPEKKTVEMRMPYEFLPLPKKGDIVDAVDRSGKFVTKASVVSVINPPSFDKTPVVSISFDRQFMYDVRNIKLNTQSVGEVQC